MTDFIELRRALYLEFNFTVLYPTVPTPERPAYLRKLLKDLGILQRVDWAQLVGRTQAAQTYWEEREAGFDRLWQRLADRNRQARAAR